MTKYVLLASLLFAACGDNNDNGDDSPLDGGIDAPVDSAPAAPRAVIATGNFSSAGLLSVLDIATKTIMTNVAPATSVGVDPVVRKVGNELFVVNRASGNSITVLKASDFSLVEQLATGAGSNPYDVAVVGSKLYVPVYGGTGLVVLTRGTSTSTTIALGATEDPDNKPNCATAYAVGTKVFVGCQLLDDANSFASRGLTGRVYVIDTTTNTVAATLMLSTENPTSMFEQLPSTATHAGDLVVGTSDYGTGAGCLERITTGATPTAAGCLRTNAELGGFANRVDFSTTKMVVSVGRADFSGGDVRTIDLATDALDAAKYNKADQPIQEAAVCPDGTVVMAETPPFSTTTPPVPPPQGLRLYSAAGVETTTTAIDIGMKANSTHGLYCY